MDRRLTCGRCGFTLIELLAVVGIIVVLIGMVMVGAGMAQRLADRNRARANLEKIQTALNRYVMDYTQYPSNIVNPKVWAVLTNYVPDIRLVDPWGNTNRYRRLWGHKPNVVNPDPVADLRERGDAYELKSAGPDGIFDTNDDVVTARTD